MSERKWYAVYTMPRWEKKVAERLTKNEIENYCPLNRVLRQWADRKKIVVEPLFTSYVFVHVCEAEHLAIRKTDGIINFVYWLGKPAVIREEEIFAIRKFLGEFANVAVEKTDVRINDKVRFVEGPLLENEGHVIKVVNRKIMILLPSLGYIIYSSIENPQLKIEQSQSFGINMKHSESEVRLSSSKQISAANLEKDSI